MIALGSLSELETHYLLSVRLKFTSKNEEFEKILIETKKLLLGFRNYIAKK